MFPTTRPTLRFDEEPPHAAQRTSTPRGDEATRRYAQGDSAAFGEVYDEVHPRVRAFVRRRMRDDQVTDDLVQHTFLRMIEARGRFAPGCAVMPWAIAIAANLMRDEERRRVRASRVFDPAEPPDSRDWYFPAADEVSSANQVMDRVERLVAKLPEQQRTAYELIRIHGLTQIEAAEVIGSTVAAIKAACHRACQALRDAFTEHDPK